MNYTSLQAAITEWLQSTAATGSVEQIIQIAEGRLKNDVIARSIEKQLVGNTTQPVVFLPTDLNVIQRLVVYKSQTEHSVLIQAPASAESKTNTVGFPKSYNLLDQSMILYPTPDAAYRYILYYIPTVRPLTDSQPTNWLIERAPNVYLYACLKEAAVFIKDWESAGQYEGMYLTSLAGITSADDRTRFPLSAPLTIRARKP